MSGVYFSDFLAAVAGQGEREFLASCPYPALLEVPAGARLSEPELRFDEPRGEERGVIVRRRLEGLLPRVAELRLFFVAPPAPGERVLVGRSEGAVLTPDQRTVSGRHAELFRKREFWRVQDLESHNGTFVEGSRIPVGIPLPLGGGQYLAFGEYQTLLLEPAQLYRLALLVQRQGRSTLTIPSPGMLLYDLLDVTAELDEFPPPAAPPFLVQIPVKGLQPVRSADDEEELTTIITPAEALASERSGLNEETLVHTLTARGDKPFVVLGRGADCDVILPEKSVSKRHAQLREYGDFWQLMDLESQNGTAIGIRRLPSGVLTAIQSGETLRFSRYACVFLEAEGMGVLLNKLRQSVPHSQRRAASRANRLERRRQPSTGASS